MKKVTRWFLALLAGALMASPYACQSTAAPVGGSVIKDPREVPPPMSRATPGIVHVDLVAKEIVAELTPGKTFPFWTFNGTVPGPLIRVMEGDMVEVSIENALSNGDPHNLDFHAALGPGGGAPVTNVEPGEKKTFHFRATRRGAYIYHCAGEGMPWEHVAHGMFGLIQVDPPGGLAPGYRELYVGQSEWYVGDPGEEEREHAKDPAPTLGLDTSKATAERPDFFTFNGHTGALSTGPLAQAMTVMQGDKVRVFFVNGGPNATSSLHVIGTIFDRVYGGHPDDALRNEETVSVPPGSATVVEFAADVPGVYSLVDHALFRVPRGALALIHVEPTRAPTGADPSGSWPLDLYDPPALNTDPMGH